MACRYTYNGKTYEAHQFDDVLRAMPPEVFARFSPSVSSIPSAPFVTKTENWVALALKRAIKWAIDHDFDRVAFTTGQQNADRYDLSNQITSLAVYRDGDGFKVSFSAINGGTQPARTIKDADELADTIGKDLAQKAIADLGERRSMVNYTGLDLRVGGEGMLAFYDKILPQVTRDVLKRLGGGQLGTTTIGAINKENLDLPLTFDPADAVIRQHGNTFQVWAYGLLQGDVSYKTREEAEAFLATGGGQIQTTQPAFDITDKMRDAAGGGMALFSRAREDAPLTRWAEAVLDGRQLNKKTVVVASEQPHPVLHMIGLDPRSSIVLDGPRLQDHVFSRHPEIVPGMVGRIASMLEKPLAAIRNVGRDGNGKAFVQHQVLVDYRDAAGRPILIALRPSERSVRLDDGRQHSLEVVDIRTMFGREDALFYVMRQASQAPGLGGMVWLSEKGVAAVRDFTARGMIPPAGNAGSPPSTPATTTAIVHSTEALRLFEAGDRTWGRAVEEIIFPRDLLSQAKGLGIGTDDDPTPPAGPGGGRPRDDAKRSPARSLERLRDIDIPAINYKVSDLLGSSKKLTWWDKSVGTMYHLAERHPSFKRVYDAVQRFIGDVSTYATRAAELAPDILPRLESLKDVMRSPLSPEDIKALSGPIFSGTLRYARDEDGKAVLTDDVGAAGVVWKDDELRSMWSLDDRQIGLYRQARKALNRSISDLAVTDMLRFAGEDADGVRQRVLEAGSIQRAEEILVQHLGDLANASERADVLLSTIAGIKAKAQDARGLIAKGYAPLSRYGDYTVYVTRGTGDAEEQLYFGMFESQRDANKMAREMREQYPDADVKAGTMSKEFYKLFNGVTPETLALFGRQVGLEESGTDRESQMFQEYLKRATSTRSAMKHLIERKGVAGFSEDVGRVLAGFVYSNGRQSAVNLHAGAIAKSVAAIKENEPQNGDLLDMAVKLREYVQNGQEEAQGIRGLLFVQYIGGSLASAMVNLTQSFTTTLPTLTMHFGAARTGKALADALNIVRSGAAGDKALADAMLRAERDGVTAPQEVHQLMAQAQGRGSLRTGDGTVLGNALAQGGNMASKLQLVWGKAFGWAEQMNRRIAFVAAYKLARERGEGDPFAFAEKIVNETQYVMNKGNNPMWARGPVGATLFTFKKFMVNYLEGLARMWGNGPEGKKAFAMSLALLWLFAGASGLPGVDDLDDIIDGFAQRVLNLNWSTDQAREEFFVDLIGQAGADFVLRGVSGLPGVPMDVSGRLGLGNIVPGTGLFVKKQDHGSDASEVIGVAADFGKRVLTAAGQAAQGDFVNATQSIVPVAAANAYKGLQMAQLGYYKDAKNRKVIDTDLAEAMLKGIGFQPAAVARVQEASRTQQGIIAVNKIREAEIADLWARGRVERDPEMVEDAKRQMREWNEANPHALIEIDPAQINRRVKQAMMDKAQRLSLTAPREIRAAVKEALQR